jgi:hypothetical protein
MTDQPDEDLLHYVARHGYVINHEGGDDWTVTVGPLELYRGTEGECEHFAHEDLVPALVAFARMVTGSQIDHWRRMRELDRERGIWP